MEKLVVLPEKIQNHEMGSLDDASVKSTQLPAQLVESVTEKAATGGGEFTFAVIRNSSMANPGSFAAKLMSFTKRNPNRNDDCPEKAGMEIIRVAHVDWLEYCAEGEVTSVQEIPLSVL